MEDPDAERNGSECNSRNPYILCTDERTRRKPVLGGDMQKGYTGTDTALQYLFDNATEVEAEQVLVAGTAIAVIEVDGDPMPIYAPSQKGITVSNGKVSLT